MGILAFGIGLLCGWYAFWGANRKPLAGCFRTLVGLTVFVILDTTLYYPVRDPR